MRKEFIRRPSEEGKASVVDMVLGIHAPMAVENMTLADIIQRVMEAVDENKDNGVQAMLDRFASVYGITSRQALVLCACMALRSRNIDMNDLSRCLGISRIKALSLNADIRQLISLRLLRYCNVKEEKDFFVPLAVAKAIHRNEAYATPSYKGLCCTRIFDLMEEWFGELRISRMDPKEIKEELKRLYEENPQVDFVKRVLDLELDDNHMVLLSLFCSRLVNDDDDDIYFSDIEDLYETREAFARDRKKLQKGEHRLFKLHLLDYVCEDGMTSTTRFRLTDEVKNVWLAEVYTSSASDVPADVIEASTLTTKQLFYVDGNRRQVDELCSFLGEEHYRQIRQRMKQRGMRSGFACLFYGGPGTGKTETVYQLARRTGRDIMMVDVPQVKSKWVGESEKNIKAVFERYSRLARRRSITPILLFNEADAIVGRRKNEAENAVDKMENAIQNIILQEMENLDGIMIATTNLEGNMDPAFERRFLYKIRFENPDANVRSKIWQSMMPELSGADAAALADSYSFSGGQIENIVRKNTINSILHGDAECQLSVLRQYCDEELIKKTAKKQVGFCAY